MRLSIKHTTHYRFDKPVNHGLQRLRLTPKATQGQTIEAWKMRYDGGQLELEYDDQNFNHTTLISLFPGTQELIIECEGVVDTIATSGVLGDHAGFLPLWSFLAQTKRTKPGQKLISLIASARRSDGDTLAMLHDLSAATIEAVKYETGVTNVDSTAEEALIAGAGVCQDHAQIFIGAARALEIPARYVSGYLMMDDRIAQEATHAWAEAYVDGLGWVGFDISNGISPDERYVRVATGRDYRDAAPVTGVNFGAVASGLTVDVIVEQQSAQQ